MSAKTKTTKISKAAKDFKFLEVSVDDRPAFEAADNGRLIAQQLKQRVFDSLTAEQRDAITAWHALMEIYDQVAPSDFYRVPKAKPSTENFQANIERAGQLLLTLSQSTK